MMLEKKSKSMKLYIIHECFKLKGVEYKECSNFTLDEILAKWKVYSQTWSDNQSILYVEHFAL